MNTFIKKIRSALPYTLLLCCAVVLLIGVPYGAHIATAATGATPAATAPATGGGATTGSGILSSIVGTFMNFTIGSILQIVGYFLYFTLTLVSFGLVLCGGLLNVSLYFTTHLGTLIGQTTVIFTVWSILRNIASIFIIFAILWAAMQMILDIQQANYKQLLINIVIVGILINFSFFFTQILIDASNIVSLEFYDAMAPEVSLSQCSNLAANGVNSYTTCVMGGLLGTNHSGLAEIFMNAFDIQAWYSNQNQLTVTNAGTAVSQIGTNIRVIIINAGAIVVTIIASLSFVAASAAAIWRIAVLIFLLAFSPLWIVGFALPQLKKEVSDEWWKHLKANLIFLPVYLLLMYVAVSIVNGIHLSSFAQGAASAVTAGSTGSAWYTPFVELFVGFSIIIFMLNLPLFTAIKFAGASGTILEKVSKGARSWVQQRAWTYTGGRLASAALRSESLQNFASNWKVGEIALKGVRGAAGSYEQKLASQVKNRTELAESLGYDQKAMRTAQSSLRSAQSNLASAKAQNAAANIISQHEAAVGAAKQAVAGVENARKENYAKRIGNRTLGIFGSSDTLFTKVARKDKVAAAKIQIPIVEKQITQRKESLKETRDDLKQLTNAIRNNRPGAGLQQTSAGPATPQQQADLARLQTEEVNKLAAVNGLETTLDNLKLTK